MSVKDFACFASMTLYYLILFNSSINSMSHKCARLWSFAHLISDYYYFLSQFANSPKPFVPNMKTSLNFEFEIGFCLMEHLATSVVF